MPKSGKKIQCYIFVFGKKTDVFCFAVSEDTFILIAFILTKTLQSAKFNMVDNCYF